jgi:hypothetical protein
VLGLQACTTRPSPASFPFLFSSFLVGLGFEHIHNYKS